MELEISGGKVLVSDEDYDRVNQFSNWYVFNNNGILYAARNVRDPNHHLILMHRFILGATDPKVFVDHINRNGLDNQRENIRLCSRKNNSRNRGKIKKPTTSIYKGVHLCRGKWKCVLRADKKFIYGGLFSDEEEAAKEYDRLALIHFKEFAKLNFPTDI